MRGKISEWAAASWVHLCGIPGIRTLSGKGVSLSGKLASSPSYRPSAAWGPGAIPHSLGDRGATPGHGPAAWRMPTQQLQRSPHRLPTRDPSWEGHCLGPHLAQTAHASPARPRRGPSHSLCHSVMETMPRAAWGAFGGGSWPGRAVQRTEPVHAQGKLTLGKL